MAVQVISLTPIEQEAYVSDIRVMDTVELVGRYVQDEFDDDEDVKIVLTMNDIDNSDTFGLAFSGSQLSLEFSPDVIQVCDFNDGDEEILMAYPRDQVRDATLWLLSQV